MNGGCIFCSIGKDKINSYGLYDDDLVMAFLDVNPVAVGHILVISKDHYENIFDAPEDVLERINVVCRKMGELCKSRLGATGVNVLNASGKDAQQSVSHLHYHVVPRSFEDGLDLWFHGDGKKGLDLEEVYEKLK